jgi:hypothetical protein
MDTTGLKWAPLTGPRVRINTPRANTVEIVFAIRATSESLDRLLAIIPEPTTAATSKAVPRNSAKTDLKFMVVLSGSKLVDFRIA